DPVGVGGVYTDLPEPPLVGGVADGRAGDPGVAAVGGAEDAAAVAGGVGVDGVDDAGVGGGHGHADAADVGVGGEAVGQLVPRLAAAGGAVDARAGAAVVVVVGAAAALPGGGVEGVRATRVQREVHDARGVVDEEGLRPRLAAVRRAVDAAVGVGGVELPLGRHPDDGGVRGVDEDAADGAGLLQPEVLPRLAAVGGAEYALAAVGDGAAAAVDLAGADVDRRRVRGVERHVADGEREHVVADGGEGGAAVGGAEDAAGAGADEEPLPALDGQRRHAPAD